MGETVCGFLPVDCQCYCPHKAPKSRVKRILNMEISCFHDDNGGFPEYYNKTLVTTYYTWGRTYALYVTMPCIPKNRTWDVLYSLKKPLTFVPVCLAAISHNNANTSSVTTNSVQKKGSTNTGVNYTLSLCRMSPLTQNREIIRPPQS